MPGFLKYALYTLLLVVSAVLLYFLIKFLVAARTIEMALAAALVNTQQCGQDMCPPVTSIIKPIPTTISTKTFDLLTAQYCSTIVYSIIIAILDKTIPVYPADLTLIKELYDSPSNPISGAILSSHGNAVLWLSFRGSQTIDDWKVDFNLNQTALSATYATDDHHFSMKPEKKPRIHQGFLSRYRMLRPQILETIKTVDPKKSSTLVVTGHSLGAALATLAGLDLVLAGYTNVIVYNFASPRVGDRSFTELVDQSMKVYRIVNSSDLIPTLPLSVQPNMTTPNQPSFYSHCGSALYFSDNWLSLLNNHNIAIYMKNLEFIQ